MTVNPLRMDPSRTAGPRRTLLAEFRKRLGTLRQQVAKLLLTISAGTGDVPDVQDWLATQARIALLKGTRELQVSPQRTGVVWYAGPALQVYRRAAGGVWDKVSRRRGISKTLGPLTESARLSLREQFVSRLLRRRVSGSGLRTNTRSNSSSSTSSSTFFNVTNVAGSVVTGYEDIADPGTAAAAVVSRLGLEIAGLGSAFSLEATRLILDGMARGDTVRVIAQAIGNLLDQRFANRARLIVHTELIRINAEAALDAGQEFVDEGVEVFAVWVADENPCQWCLEHDGGIYDLEDARGLIPLHPSCSCTWDVQIDDEVDL